MCGYLSHEEPSIERKKRPPPLDLSSPVLANAEVIVEPRVPLKNMSHGSSRNSYRDNSHGSTRTSYRDNSHDNQACNNNGDSSNHNNKAIPQNSSDPIAHTRSILHGTTSQLLSSNGPDPHREATVHKEFDEDESIHVRFLNSS